MVGVKASVIGTGDLPATRSDDVMLKNTEETAVVGAAVGGAAVATKLDRITFWPPPLTKNI